MIAYLKGELTESRPGKIVIEVNNIGYNVLVSDSLREELPELGSQVKIYTYTAVREDDISLYGFLTRDSIDMFNMLIGVSGVGPKGALMILSVFSVMDLKYAIVTENSTLISKAPTIGKKTAEKIIIDLKDKFNKDDIFEIEGPSVSVSSFDSKSLSSNAKDAVDALTALGYDSKESLKAVKSVEGVNEMDTNDILKNALKYLL